MNVIETPAELRNEVEESDPMPPIRAPNLVADDLEIIQQLTRSFLETAGHEVDVVTPV